MAMPTNVDTGKVVGRFIIGVADGPDPDNEPDALPASGTIAFTASVPYLPDPTEGTTILKVPIIGVLDSEGYLCAPDPADPSKAGTRGLRLIATDDPDLSVQGWTWNVTYTFGTVNGVRPQVASHSMALPSGATIDLTTVVKVPSSTGIGTEQAEALAVLAQQAATDAATAAQAANDAALAASTAAQATDAGVALLVTGDGATTAALDRTYRAHTSVKEYGALGDGTTDDTTAVQAALNAGAGGSVYFPPGAYRLTGPLTVPTGTSVSGAGSGASLLDWSTRPGFAATSLLAWAKGTVSDPSPLTVDTVVGDAQVTVSPGHTFQAGDWVRITADETTLSGEAVKGEFQRVLTVAGSVLTLAGSVYDTYTQASAGRVERANLSTGAISGLSIRGKGINSAGYGDTAVEFSLARDVSVTDVHFEHIENKCLLMQSVVGLSVADCYFRFHPSFTPLQYGVALTGACQMASIRGCSSWNDRHLVTTSTSQSLLAASTASRGIPRIITITGCTANGSWQAPIDTHRGGEYVTVVGNALTSESTGIKIRGANALVSGNTITGKSVSLGGSPFGVRVGMVGDNVRVTGNVIRGFDTGVRIETPDGTTKSLVVADNSIVDCKWAVYLGASTTVLDKVQVCGNYFSVPATGYGLYVTTTVNDLDVSQNVFDGGVQGVYMASPTLPITRLLIHGNSMRGQSSYGMYLRNLTDAFVAGNFSATREIRFAATCTRVTAAVNGCTITDLSDGKTVVIK